MSKVADDTAVAEGASGLATPPRTVDAPTRGSAVVPREYLAAFILLTYVMATSTSTKSVPHRSI